MQIHEITRRPVNEGLWDTVKSLATWNPGESFAQAKARVRYNKNIDDIAQRAQTAWRAYEEQLAKYVATLPAPAPKTATAPVIPAGQRIRVPYQAQGQSVPSYYFKTAQGWTNELGQPVTAADSVRNLEALAATQGRKETDPNFQPPGQAKTAPKSKKKQAVSEQAPATATDAYKSRTDGRYEQALKRFVQKNLFSGRDYGRLANAQEIDQLISTMSRPENADPRRQEPLWKNLALAAAVAQTVPVSAGGLAAEPEPGAQAADDTAGAAKTAQELVDPIEQNLEDNQVDTGVLNRAGQIVRQEFTNNRAEIRSTGNPNVDALLLSMGFRI